MVCVLIYNLLEVYPDRFKEEKCGYHSWTRRWTKGWIEGLENDAVASTN